MGCGWLGLPLAISLLEKGFSVRGSTTDLDKVSLLKESGIDPYVISLGEESIDGNIDLFLKGIDSIVINIPPALRGGNSSNYFRKIEQLYGKLKAANVSKVIFISSTSVYGSVSGQITEDTTPKPDSESGKQLLQAENLFLGDTSLLSTIVRFGGLIGPGRHPARQLSGRKGLSNGHHPVNLIHLEDCIRLITAILQQDWWKTIFNGVYPDHPTKQDYYTSEAVKRGLEAPDYIEEPGSSEGKIVESASLSQRGFSFTKGIRS